MIISVSYRERGPLEVRGGDRHEEQQIEDTMST